VAAEDPPDGGASPGAGPTWVSWCPDARRRSTAPLPSLTALAAASIATSPHPMWPVPGVTTPSGWWPSPCDWWWKTGDRTGSPHGTSGAITGASFPAPPASPGSRPVGKQAAGRRASDDLAWALADVSGDIAADARYDGPFGGLSLVDHRRVTRLLSDGLDHQPTHEDIRSLFRGFQAALDARSLTVLGLTTAASPRTYPGGPAAVRQRRPRSTRLGPSTRGRRTSLTCSTTATSSSSTR
jgi:hypothetical protein